MDDVVNTSDLSARGTEPADLPRVVALMPTHNSVSYVGRMLDSLDAQTYPNLEILISDDRSTDGTDVLCQDFARNRSNVRLVVQDRNLGWIDNSNHLLNATEEEYVFFSFDDDELAPTYVAELLQALLSNPTAAVAYSDMLLSHSDGPPELLSFDSLIGVECPVERGRILFGGAENLWIVFRGLYRRSISRDMKCLRRHWFGERGADWLWLCGMALRGDFVRVPKTLYTKHKRPGSVGGGLKKNSLIRLAIFVMRLREILDAPLSWFDKVRLMFMSVARPVASPTQMSDSPLPVDFR